MRLEQEIKQLKPFRSSLEKSLVNIIYTNNAINMVQNKKIKQYGVSLEQYNVLRILKGQNNKPLTINGIIDRMLDKMSNASRLVDKLYLKGLVERRQKEGNRRACDVTLTNKGKELLEKLNVEMAHVDGETYGISNEEFETLNVLLDKFRANITGNEHA